MFTPDLAKKTPIVMEMLFTSEWLKEKAKDDPQGRTNFQVQTEVRTHPHIIIHTEPKLLVKRNISAA